FPIRKPPDQSLVDGSPGTIVASHVLHRFLVPRHPPCALKNLATDARVHCAVLKQRPDTHLDTPNGVRSVGPAGSEATTITAVPSGPNNVPDTPNPQIRFPRRSSTRGPETRVCRIV